METGKNLLSNQIDHTGKYLSYANIGKQSEAYRVLTHL